MKKTITVSIILLVLLTLLGGCTSDSVEYVGQEPLADAEQEPNQEQPSNEILQPPALPED